jgi:uncharacterized protein YbbC (DUF1343 family)
MQSAAKYGKEFWVLDRPNPVGGAIVEGPVLEEAEESFIGLYPIAMRHGMTVGELAKLFNDHFNIGAKLRVVAMRGYTREMIWPDTGLHWIRSSPNIPTWQTTFPYLATGLIDNAGVNNGVGTEHPFFYAGGYGLDGNALADNLNSRNLSGVQFRPASYSPSRGFWRGKTLTGVELDVFDPRTFYAVNTAVEILCAVRSIAPKQIRIDKPASLDRDWGTPSLREGLSTGKRPEAIIAGWEARLDAFRKVRANYLIY